MIDAAASMMDQLLAWSAILGVCAAILKNNRLAKILITPAAIRWLVLPIFAGMLTNLSFGERVLAVLVATIATIAIIAGMAGLRVGPLLRIARIVFSIIGGILRGLLYLVGMLFQRLELQALVRFHLGRGRRPGR
jgi:hypothetical protein